MKVRSIVWVFAAFVATLGVFWIWRFGAFQNKVVSVNGHSVSYKEGGSGPTLVFLKATDDDWLGVLSSLKDKFKIAVFSSSESPENLDSATKAINFSSPYLMAEGLSSSLALKLALAPSHFKSFLIFVNPEFQNKLSGFNDLSGLKQPVLILLSRNRPHRELEASLEFVRRLPNAQFSIHPKAGGDLMSEEPGWVADKVAHFIEFTRRVNTK